MATKRQRVEMMKRNGYEFALCWNFHLDCKKAFDKAKRYKVEKVTDVIRGIRIKNDYGKNVALVILHKGATYKSGGRIEPTQTAIEVLSDLGLLPVKTKIAGDFFNRELISFQWADTDDILAFYGVTN